MMSHYITMMRATSAGNLVTRFTSQSWQPPSAVGSPRYRTLLTESQHSVTKATGLSNTLRVQKGQNGRKGYCDTVP